MGFWRNFKIYNEFFSLALTHEKTRTCVLKEETLQKKIYIVKRSLSE